MTKTKQSHEGILAYINPQAEKELDNMKKQRHTKTPWTLHEGQDYIEIFSPKDESILGEIICAPDYVRHDTEFIIKAVNSYEYLKQESIQRGERISKLCKINGTLIEALKEAINGLNQIPNTKNHEYGTTYKLITYLEQALKEAESEEI